MNNPNNRRRINDTVSICMPYYERIVELQAGLLAFNRHGYFDYSYPYAVELVLMDDGSIREPLPTAKEFLGKYGIPAVVGFLPQKTEWDNPCVPLNRAVEMSSGEWLLIQSPETIHRVDVLHPMMEMAGGDPYVSVMTPVVSRDAKGALIWRSHPKRPDRLWFCQLVSRELWEKAGGNDERFRGAGGCDDRALQIRLEKAGVKWKFLPEEYFAYHRKHEKAFRYLCGSNRDKIHELYGVEKHVPFNADLTPEEIGRLGLENGSLL